jgi:hypothetical protein
MSLETIVINVLLTSAAAKHIDIVGRRDTHYTVK